MLGDQTDQVFGEVQPSSLRQEKGRMASFPSRPSSRWGIVLLSALASIVTLAAFFTGRASFSDFVSWIRSETGEHGLDAPRPAPVDFGRLCVGIFNSFECARAIEEAQHKANPMLFERQGSRLILQLKDDRQLTLTDEGEDANSVAFSFREFLPGIGYFLIEIQYWEGSAYLLVDRASGKRYPLDGIPVLSPERQRLVVTSLDLHAGYSPNSISVWKVGSSGLTREWYARLDELGWGPSDPVWFDEHEIGITRNELHPDTRATTRTTLSLVRSRGRWRLYDPTGTPVRVEAL